MWSCFDIRSPLHIIFTDTVKEEQYLQRMSSFWLDAVQRWYVLSDPDSNTRRTPPTHFLSIREYISYYTQQVECCICLYLFQSKYIQNKSEELNQEQKDLEKKNTGKRKSRDTDEESRE